MTTISYPYLMECRGDGDEAVFRFTKDILADRALQLQCLEKHKLQKLKQLLARHGLTHNDLPR